MGRGFAWLDTGTIDAINNASNFINKNRLDDIIKKLPNDYANYLRRLTDN